MAKFGEIETFVRVVEAGSITRAAEQLKIAKSAVSRRLKELEARLGVQLMTRTTRKLTLTEPGEILYNRSVVLLADWAESESAASDAQCLTSDTVRRHIKWHRLWARLRETFGSSSYVQNGPKTAEPDIA